MKNLLYKEFTLATHPTTFIFLFFGMMMLIPAYPYYVVFFYTTLALFFIFLTGRENKDVFYTVTLPIRKRDAVKARCWMVAILELAYILISVPFAVLSVHVNKAGNLAGIEANAAFYGLVFLLLALFNMIFIPTFYKTAYKAGTAFIFGSIAVVLFILAAEALVWFPSPLQAYLDTTAPGTFLKQLPLLLAGIILWVLAMLLTYKRSAANFEKVDL
jgi:hypothetical protein